MLVASRSVWLTNVKRPEHEVLTVKFVQLHSRTAVCEEYIFIAIISYRVNCIICIRGLKFVAIFF